MGLVECLVDPDYRVTVGRARNFLVTVWSVSLGKNHSFLPGLSLCLDDLFCTSCIVIPLIFPLRSLLWNLLFGNYLIFPASDPILKSCALHGNPVSLKGIPESGAYHSSDFHMVMRRATLHSNTAFGFQPVVTRLGGRLSLEKRKNPTPLNSSLHYLCVLHTFIAD